jgi:hypothetical protein
MNKRFSVTFVLEIDEDNNLLSSVEEAHIDDVYDLIKDLFYDVDDVEVENITVKERL